MAHSVAAFSTRSSWMCPLAAVCYPPAPFRCAANMQVPVLGSIRRTNFSYFTLVKCLIKSRIGSPESTSCISTAMHPLHEFPHQHLISTTRTQTRTSSTRKYPSSTKLLPPQPPQMPKIKFRSSLLTPDTNQNSSHPTYTQAMCTIPAYPLQNRRFIVPLTYTFDLCTSADSMNVVSPSFG